MPEASSSIQGKISVSSYRYPLLEKSAIKVIDSSQDKYLSSIFLVKKKRFKPEAIHQSIKLEPAYPLGTFQNRWNTSFKRAFEGTAFSMPGRLERCKLRCSIAQRIAEFCIFHVKRQILSICLPLF